MFKPISSSIIATLKFLQQVAESTNHRWFHMKYIIPYHHYVNSNNHFIFIHMHVQSKKSTFPPRFSQNPSLIYIYVYLAQIFMQVSHNTITNAARPQLQLTTQFVPPPAKKTHPIKSSQHFIILAKKQLLFLRANKRLIAPTSSIKEPSTSPLLIPHTIALCVVIVSPLPPSRYTPQVSSWCCCFSVQG